MWYVYILECADKTFYTGITNNLKRRLDEHNDSGKGAKYTRGRRPVKLVYKKRFKDKSRAAKEEWTIKSLNRQKKEDLILS